MKSKSEKENMFLDMGFCHDKIIDCIKIVQIFHTLWKML